MAFRNDPEGLRLRRGHGTARHERRLCAGRSHECWYDVPQLAALEPEAARAAVEGDEFIFDVQGHFVNPTGASLKRLPEGARPLRGITSDPRCEPHEGPGDLDYLRCVGPDQLVKDVFLDSDTDLMVLSFVPSTVASTRTRPAISSAWTCSRRSTRCRRGRPTRNWARTRRASGWTTLGVCNIAIHKGLSFGPQSYEHSTCRGIGRVAKRYPDVNFLIYHSGFVADAKEGP